MKHSLAVAAALAALALHVHAQLVINEIRIDDPLGDDFEYVELYNAGAIDVTLSNFTYVVIGDGATGSGTIEDVIALPSQTLSPGQHFLLSPEPVLNIDTDSNGVSDIVASPFVNPVQFENGDNVTHLLVTGFLGSDNQDLDVDDDGVLDATPWTTVVDAVGVVDSAGSGDLLYADALGGFPEVGPFGGGAPAHLFRAPDNGLWAIGAEGVETGTNPNLLQGTFDTPGLANGAAPALSVTFSSPSVLESDDGTNAITATVTRDVVTADPLDVAISVSDSTEASAQVLVTIPASQPSETFQIFAVDDFVVDGDQTVDIGLAAEGAISGGGSIMVLDDAVENPPVVINEIYYASDPTSGDANNDGIIGSGSRNADDFIELVNVSAAPVDISGWALIGTEGFQFSNEGIHRFPAGTVLDPGCAIVVFGGPTVTVGTTAAFGTTQVQTSSNNGMFLEEDGTEIVTLLNPLDQQVGQVTLPDVTADTTVGSYNLNTDGVLTSGYAFHTVITASPTNQYSPGTTTAGAAYCNITQALTAVVTSLADPDGGNGIEEVLESAAPGSAQVQVSIPSAIGTDLVVTVTSSDESELVPSAATVIIPMGSTSAAAPLPLDPVDDGIEAGIEGPSVTVTVTAIASGYLNASDTIDVLDDGDGAALTDVFVNEIRVDQSGTDTDEYVELFSPSAPGGSLSGLTFVVLQDNGVIDDFVDLTGQALDSNGLFLIAEASPLPTSGATPNLVDDLNFENGENAAYFLVTGFTGTIGQDLDTNDDGVFDATPWDMVLDGLAFVDDEATIIDVPAGPEDINYGPALGIATVGPNGTFIPAHAYRVTDGSATWNIGSFTPDANDTPGASNGAVATDPPDILFIFPDFAGGNVIMNIANLSPGVTYTLESSVNPPTNAGQVAFGTVTTFTTADGVGMGGVFQFAFADASISGKTVNIYRVSAP